MHQHNPSRFKFLLILHITVSLITACSGQSRRLPNNSAIVDSTSTTTTSPTVTPSLAPTKTPQPTSTTLPTTIPTPVSGQTAADQLLQDGEDNLRKGNFEEAIADYNQAIVLYPWSLEAYYGLSTARKNLVRSQEVAKLDEEIVQLDQAINQNSGDSELYYQRGMAKFNRIIISGEPKVEEAIYHDVTVVGDMPVMAHVDLKEAVLDFDQAIQKNIRFAEAYHKLGLAHHLESLNYGGFPLIQINQEGIRKAIQYYEKAIQYDPELAIAYNDIGAAHAHLAMGGMDLNQEEQFKEIEQAIEGYSKAINSDPQMTRTYLNRAYAVFYLFGLLGYQKGSDEEKETTIQLGIDDTTHLIEVEPWNPWGYFIRGILYQTLIGVVKNSNDITKWEDLAEEDGQKAEEVGHFLFLQHDVTEWISRLTTLSSGTPIFPDDAAIIGNEYVSPDLDFRLEIPDLMSPNATMLAEQAESGDFLIRFYDDLGRWYALQVHPGSLGDQGLGEWVQTNLAQNLKVSKEIKISNKDVETIEILYRDEKHDADCGASVQYHNERYYTVTYCLMDETDIYSSYRLFAEGYQIQFSPVDKILEGFLQNLDILTE